MATAKTWKIAREIGDAVIKASRNPNRRWYGPHMAAAVRAISERIPLVDFVLEIRDARVRFLCPPSVRLIASENEAKFFFFLFSV